MHRGAPTSASTNPTQIFISSTAESTSRRVRARCVIPLSEAAHLIAGRSSQPTLLALPVVVPYSPPTRLMVSAVSSKSSVGIGPSPTLVVYALVTPMTCSMLLGGTPEPTTAPPTVGLEEVTKG